MHHCKLDSNIIIAGVSYRNYVGCAVTHAVEVEQDAGPFVECEF
jgi:hypothetical protein